MFPQQQQNDSNDSSSSKHSWTCFHKYNNTTFIKKCINHNLVYFSLSGVSQLCIASILPFCSSACLTVFPVSPVILLFLISEPFPPSSQLGINLSKVIQGVILFDFWPLLATKLVVGIFSFCCSCRWFLDLLTFVNLPSLWYVLRNAFPSDWPRSSFHI